jgi:hypothetical protein
LKEEIHHELIAAILAKELLELQWKKVTGAKLPESTSLRLG